MRNATLETWRTVCLLTLGGFVGMSLASFAAGLPPGDLSLRHALLDHANSLAAWAPRAVDIGGPWMLLVPRHAPRVLLSRAAGRPWWLWCAILIGSSLIEHAVKYLVGRPRPSGFSLGFPSGHATAAATFAVVVIYISGRERLGPRARFTIQAAV